MRKEILAVLGAALLWSSCKEQNALLDFGPTSVSDTTYVMAASDLPALDLHNVLVEEFTGQSCTNCPAAHTLLEDIVKQPGNGSRINVVCLYAPNTGPQTTPPGGPYDLRYDKSSDIRTTFYTDFQGLPQGGVDRKLYSGNITLFSTDWSSAINIQKGTPDSVNLVVKSTYDSVAKKATIKVQVIYLNKGEVTVPQNLHVMVVEDSIIGSQELGSGATDDHYLFTGVLRNLLTSVPNGDPLTAARTTGRVFQRIFNYTPAPHYPSEPAPKASNLRVIAFVANAATGDNQVIQSVQAPLAGH